MRALVRPKETSFACLVSECARDLGRKVEAFKQDRNVPL